MTQLPRVATRAEISDLLVLFCSAAHEIKLNESVCSLVDCSEQKSPCFNRLQVMRIWRMRTGISITLRDGDRQRLNAIVAGRNTPQKHVWRARIVLLSADEVGTNAIMAATGKSKTCVWRWQERFASAGVDGLLRDKTRPPGKPSIAVARVEEVVRRTLEPPPLK